MATVLMSGGVRSFVLVMRVMVVVAMALLGAGMMVARLADAGHCSAHRVCRHGQRQSEDYEKAGKAEHRRAIVARHFECQSGCRGDATLTVVNQSCVLKVHHA